ncbi:MAG: thiamine phosphate synthase [Desulfuromonadales bacterium]|nr:thiamine phosphate synthase [Desulfuromonadales bacterium]
MPTVSRRERQRTGSVDFPLYLITDRHQTAGRPLTDVVRAVLQSGVRAVQLREKDLPDNELLALAEILRTVTHEFGARLLINSRLDICRAVGADGVQLGIEGISVAEARRSLGEGMLIGYSAHSVAEACSAESAGADFVTFSPIFHTPSKAAYGEPVGLERLREACTALTIPVFALGGIKQANIAEVMSAGTRGIALISAIIAANDPADAASSLLKTIERHDTHS